MELLHDLAARLPLSFEAGTLERGREYAECGAVTLLTHVDPGTTSPALDVVATVRGSQATPYTTTLHVSAPYLDARLSSRCTCWVSWRCKHGAAVAWALVEALEPTDVTWTDGFERLLDDLRGFAPPETEPQGVALEVSRELPRGHYAGRPELGLRPLRQGARQRWVRQGLSWADVPGALMRRSHDVDQLRALDEMSTALVTHGRYWHQQVAPLGAFGPDVVGLVRRAVEAGVVLVPKAPVTALELVDERLEVAADVRAGDGEVHVRLGVRDGERLWPVDDVTLLGDPAHSVALVDDDRVRLGVLDRRLDKRALRALQREHRLDVPPDELDQLPQRVRRLTRLVPVRSGDGSVAVPEPVAPVLRVTVAWRTAAEADVRWSWAYGEDTCAVSSDDALGGLRDRAAERRVLAALPELDTSTRAVTGADTVSLALLELPAWRELEGLEVVEEQRPDFRPATEAPTVSLDLVEPEVSGHTDWLDLEVAVTIDGERIPLPDVLAALTWGHEFLVLPSGVYVPTDDPVLTRLAEAVRAAGELRERDADDRVRVRRDDLGVLAELGDVAETSSGVAQWVERAQALRDLTELPRPEPSGLATELRGYQRDGFHWLAFLWQHGLGGVLADDMGLGKTLQVLALVAHTRARGDRLPFLVVAPTSVVSAWVAESARHTPGLRVRTVDATARRRTASIAELADGADVLVTTYTLLRLEAADYADVAWGGVVLDEAQQVKNHRSQAHQAIRRLDAPFRLAVTGTPFENRLLELWSLLAITSPGLYPTQRAFTERVVRPVEGLRDEAALRRFTRRVRPFILRRTKELVARDLPPKQEQVLEVELHPRHRRLYDSRLAKERQRILGLLEEFDENRVEILASLTRLRQLSLDPALVDPAFEGVGSAKLDLLLEHLAEVTAEGHRALVFSTFTGFLGRVRARLEEAGIEHAYLDGRTRGRAAVIDQFRSGTAPVFLISLKAGGVGLTLTEADYVYVLDPWWNPAAEAQAVDRAHRIGQQRPVMVYRLIATDTVEEKVMQLKERKAELFATVVDGEGTTSRGIDAADIRALFD